MRLIYIVNSPIPSRGASTVHIMKMCEAFAKNGHDVLLMTPDRSAQDAPLANDSYSLYGVDACFEIETISSSCGSSAYGFRAACRARKLSPDLVYGRFVTGCFFSSLLGLRTIWESHAPLRDLSPAFGRFLSAMVFQRFERVVVITKALRDYYALEWRFPKSRMLVAPDAANIPERTERVVFRNSATMQVGYVGHLYTGKGMELIAPLVNLCPWAHFHIIGGMPEDITRWNHNLQHSPNVTFYGFLPYPVANRHLQSFDVLLAPYQKSVYATTPQRGRTAQDLSRWMSPLKIFEYMAAGRPIIASDLPVIREVLRNGHNSILCNPSDAAQWASALKTLRDMPDFADRIRKNGYANVLARHTWQIRATDVLA